LPRRATRHGSQQVRASSSATRKAELMHGASGGQLRGGRGRVRSGAELLTAALAHIPPRVAGPRWQPLRGIFRRVSKKGNLRASWSSPNGGFNHAQELVPAAVAAVLALCFTSFGPRRGCRYRKRAPECCRLELHAGQGARESLHLPRQHLGFSTLDCAFSQSLNQSAFDPRQAAADRVDGHHQTRALLAYNAARLRSLFALARKAMAQCGLIPADTYARRESKRQGQNGIRIFGGLTPWNDSDVVLEATYNGVTSAPDGSACDASVFGGAHGTLKRWTWH